MEDKNLAIKTKEQLTTLSHFTGKVLDSLWCLIHKGRLVHRSVLIWALFESHYTIKRTLELLDQIQTFSANDALVIGALLTPILGLTGWVIKSYASSDSSSRLNLEVPPPESK